MSQNVQNENVEENSEEDAPKKRTWTPAREEAWQKCLEGRKRYLETKKEVVDRENEERSIKEKIRIEMLKKKIRDEIQQELQQQKQEMGHEEEKKESENISTTSTISSKHTPKTEQKSDDVEEVVKNKKKKKQKVIIVETSSDDESSSSEEEVVVRKKKKSKSKKTKKQQFSESDSDYPSEKKARVRTIRQADDFSTNHFSKFSFV